MSRRRFLVTYDVADPKRLKAAFRAMSDFGEHVQLSVFVCELNAREFLQMEGRLHKILNHRQDQALIFDLGRAEEECWDSVQSIGRDYVPVPRTFVA